MRVHIAAARTPPRSEPQNSHDFLPKAIPRSALSAALCRYRHNAANWCHDVIVEEVRDGYPDEEYPAFADGPRRCPPEGVGGSDGFMDFLEVILDPGHDEH